MKNENIATFICERRKAMNLTQKQLAEQLSITDKAVSKWERGLGYPDITTLSKLAEILNVSVNELLNGSLDNMPVPKADVIVENTLLYASEVTTAKSKKIQEIIKFIITISFLLGIFICIICDLALNNRLTWSLYPIASILFSWLIIIPLFHFEQNKILKALISLSIFIVPFLFCIEQIGKNGSWLFRFGLPISIISIIYLWITFYLFKKMKNKWYASVIILILSLVLNMLIEFSLGEPLMGKPLLDVWSVISISIVIFIAVILLIIGYFRSEK